MSCRELRFCLWYFMWSTKIRKTVFVQKVAEIKRKHPKSERFMFIGTQCDLWGRPDGTG